MKPLAKTVSLVGLAATAAPSLMAFFGAIELDAAKTATLAGTVLWFAATPLWMGRELPLDADEVEI